MFTYPASAYQSRKSRDAHKSYLRLGDYPNNLVQGTTQPLTMFVLLLFLLSSVNGSLFPPPVQPDHEPLCDTCSDKVQCDVVGNNFIEIISRVG